MPAARAGPAAARGGRSGRAVRSRLQHVV